MHRSRKKLEEPQTVQAEETALVTEIQKLRRLRDKLRAEVKRRQAGVSRRVMLAGFPGASRTHLI